MFLMRYLLLFSLLLPPIAGAQQSMPRLLNEFPYGRPVYGPLLNECEVVPRLDSWNLNGRARTSTGFDVEYALSHRFILESGVSVAKEGAALPGYIPEQGLDVGASFLMLSLPGAGLTGALECNIPFDREEGESVSFEPTIVGAVSWQKFQMHLGLNAEISSAHSTAGYFLAAMYPLPHVTPFLELIHPGDRAGTTFLAPGFVIPFSSELQLGIGAPIALGREHSKSGVTMYLAFELGDEE